MDAKRKKRLSKVIGNLKNIDKSVDAINMVPLGGEPNGVAVLQDMLEKYSHEVPHEVRRKTTLSQEEEDRFERLCLQGVLTLSPAVFDLPIEQRSMYIGKLLEYFNEIENRYQVSDKLIYFTNKTLKMQDTYAYARDERIPNDPIFRDKCIATFKKRWYDEGDPIPHVEPYKMPKPEPSIRHFENIKYGAIVSVEADKAHLYLDDPDYREMTMAEYLRVPASKSEKANWKPKKTEDEEIDDDVEAIMRINASKKKKHDTTYSSTTLTPAQRIEIGEEMLSSQDWGLNLTDDPTKPGIWYNIFMDDCEDTVAEVHTKDKDGNDITYTNRRIDYRYLPDWHWQSGYVKSFKNSLKLDWVEEVEPDVKIGLTEGLITNDTKKPEEKKRVPVLRAKYTGDYFDKHQDEVAASEFLTNAENSMIEAAGKLAKIVTKEKKESMIGKVKGIPDEWTPEIIANLKKQGFGRSERYINYCDSNAKHAYQDENISLKRRREIEGFDLMRSTPSNCNTARAFILAHRQLLKGATLVYENGREFDTSIWADVDPAFFDKIKNPLGFKSGFELYEGICTGIAKYEGVKVPRYAGKSLVVGSSPFAKVKRLQRKLDLAKSKKERKRLKKKIKDAENEAMDSIRRGNSNCVISYSKSADWHDVYQFNPADYVEAILDDTIDVDQFIDDYRERERLKYDESAYPDALPEEFFEKANPTTWITPEYRRKMYTALIDSTLPEFQKTTGAELLKECKELIIGDGKNPKTLEMMAKFNKHGLQTEDMIKASDAYRWAVKVAQENHGKFSGLIRRNADDDMITALVGVYGMAKKAYKVDTLSGNKPAGKTVGDYAIQILVDHGTLPDPDYAELLDFEDVIGSSSHFVEAYGDCEEEDDNVKVTRIDRVNSIQASFTPNHHVTTKDVNYMLGRSLEQRLKDADEFDKSLGDEVKIGRLLRYEGKPLTTFNLYTDLSTVHPDDIDDFVAMADQIAMQIGEVTGSKIDKKTKKDIKRRFKESSVSESKKKHKKKETKQLAKIAEARREAYKSGELTALSYLDDLMYEDVALQQTKKGKKAKKKAKAKSIVAKCGNYSTWDEIENRYNSMTSF